MDSNRILLTLAACLTLAVESANGQAPGLAVDPDVPGAATNALVYKSIIPPKLADDMFGRRISREYLALQITVFNTDEQRSLLVNDISIDYEGLFPDGVCAEPPRPIVRGRALMSQNGPRVGNIDEAGTAKPLGVVCQTSGHELSILRGVAEKGQYTDRRNMTYLALQFIGTVGGGLTGVAGLGPVLPKAVAAFNGPGLSAFTTAFPDHTINQLNRLSDSAFAANTVVAAQRSKVMVAFVPLNLFYSKTEMKEYYKDVSASFRGDESTKVKGLKALKIRVSYNYILSTDDVPPILTAVAFDDGASRGFLDQTPVHGSITGRFLDGATISITGGDRLGLSVQLDPQRQSNDNRLFFVITPTKVIASGTPLTFEVSKGKQTTTVSKPIEYVTPLPTLTNVAPAMGNKGSDLEITLTGSNLFDAQPSLVFQNGGVVDNSIAVASVTILSATSARASLSLKDATVGQYTVKIVIGAQESGTQPFEVKAVQ